MTAEQKRDVIAQLLKNDQTRSDRAIARDVGVSKNTVAAERAEQERRGQIDHVLTRVDTAGRQQPATKPRSETVRADPKKVGDSKERAPGSTPVVPAAPDWAAGAQPNETPASPLVDKRSTAPISLERRLPACDPPHISRAKAKTHHGEMPGIYTSPLDRTPAEIDDVAAAQPVPAEIGHVMPPVPQPDPVTAALEALAELDRDQLAALADRLDLEMLQRIAQIFRDCFAVRHRPAVP